MASKLLNIALYQATWFACVVGAAHGFPWLGVIVAILSITIDLLFAPSRAAELQLILLTAAIGYAADSVLVRIGFLHFPLAAALGGPSSLWMVALWAGFATTLNSSMGWMRGRWMAALIIGAIGGPLAYIAGERLHAMQLGSARQTAILAIAIEWAAVMPLLLWINQLLHRNTVVAAVKLTEPV
jgi:hypothetical protein